MAFTRQKNISVVFTTHVYKAEVEALKKEAAENASQIERQQQQLQTCRAKVKARVSKHGVHILIRRIYIYIYINTAYIRRIGIRNVC